MSRRNSLLAWWPSRLLVLLLTSLLTASALKAQRAPACSADTVTCCTWADGAGRDIGILRLGMHIWPAEVPGLVGDMAALQPSIVRFSVGPPWREEPPLDVSATYAAVERYVRRALGKQEARWRAAADALRKLAQNSAPLEQLLIVFGPPLTTLDGDALKAPEIRRSMREEATAVHARFLVALVAEVRRLGFSIDLFEIANEPDGNWNMRIPPDLYVRLLEVMREEARTLGIALPRIAGPGLAFLASLQGYLQPPENARRMLQLLDVVSTHVWDDRVGPDFVGKARAARHLLDGLGWRAPILVSEFAPAYPLEQDRVVKRDPSRSRTDGGGPVTSDFARYAPATVAAALSLAAEGYNPLVYWEFKDPVWGKHHYGLIDWSGRRRPAFDAWAGLAALTRKRTISRVLPTADGGAGTFGLFESGRLAAVALLNPQLHARGIRIDDRDLQRRVTSGLAARHPGDVSARKEVAMTCATYGGTTGLSLPAETDTLVPLGP